MEQIQIYFQYFLDNWDSILGILTGICTLFSAIAALTSTPNDDTWAAKLYKVVDWLALNVGKAKQSGIGEKN